MLLAAGWAGSKDQLDALLRKAAIARLEDTDSEVDRVELLDRPRRTSRRTWGPRRQGAGRHGCGPRISPGRCMS